MSAILAERPLSIPESVRAAQFRTGLAITWLQSVQDIEVAVERGLIPLYQQAFADPPYEEKFEPDEVFGFLKDMLDAGGFLFTGGQADALGQIVAFVASTPLCVKPDIEDALKDRVDTGNSCYFAEDAVAKDMRRRGISRAMKSLLLEANRIAGYRSMILRTTSAPDNPQHKAVLQSGFERIDGVTQDVAGLRMDGSVRTDTRCFYQCKLS